MRGRLPIKRHSSESDNHDGDVKDRSFDNFFEESLDTSFDEMEAFEDTAGKKRPSRLNVAQILFQRDNEEPPRRSRSPSPSPVSSRSTPRSMSPFRRRCVS